MDGQSQHDTVYATNDRFTYQPRPSDDGMIGLLISRPRFTRFWYEPGQIIVTGNAKIPYKLTFRGTLENEILDEYQQNIGWHKFSKKRQWEEANSQFIRNHPASRTAAELVYRMAGIATEDNNIFQNLWQTLSPEMQVSYFGKKAVQQIEIMKNPPIIGRVAPNFTIPDTASNDVSLSDFKGKYVLLDFWGHWCGPCIMSFPKAKALYEKHRDKLEMIGIALEGADDKDKWLSAIRKNEANRTQLSDFKGNDSETFLRYKIIKYPTYLLLDKDGVVLERSSNLEAIERKLVSLGDF